MSHKKSSICNDAGAARLIIDSGKSNVGAFHGERSYPLRRVARSSSSLTHTIKTRTAPDHGLQDHTIGPQVLVPTTKEILFASKTIAVSLPRGEYVPQIKSENVKTVYNSLAQVDTIIVSPVEEVTPSSSPESRSLSPDFYI